MVMRIMSPLVMGDRSADASAAARDSYLRAATRVACSLLRLVLARPTFQDSTTTRTHAGASRSFTEDAAEMITAFPTCKPVGGFAKASKPTTTHHRFQVSAKTFTQ
ncbi:hypothetical protein HPB48_005076 [Haemaphysalis longicornis]|uniref:Uncharacterized protein n=1 Tax=Haemaphysalis longicornis TaxID=44386 RepID=A0A9J6FFK4_HAELO|nr:hypothetical protein HPB48_005076 [Haemaphysalis longicornis]